MRGATVDHRTLALALIVVCAFVASTAAWSQTPGQSPIAKVVLEADHPARYAAPQAALAKPDPATQRLELATRHSSEPLVPKPPAKEECFAVDRIVVTGLTLIARAEVAKAIEPFARPCQGNTTVKAILVTINAMHAKKGYATTQAYLPKQDLKKSRRIEIEVKEGRIAGIVYVEQPTWDQGGYFERLGKNFRAIFTANSVDAFFTSLDRFFETIDDPLERPLLFNPSWRSAGATVIAPGDVLELEAMQQGLDQINKAPSSKAKAKLDPGKEPATSVVKIANAPDDALRVVTGYDTYGTRVTGISRYRLEVARDNLIGINDTWRSSLTSARQMNELTAAVGAPFRWIHLSVDAKYSEVLLPLAATAELFSQTASIGVAGTYTAVRTPDGRLDVSIGQKVYGNRRMINDVELTPQVFSALELGASYMLPLGSSGMWTVGTKGSVGGTGFGATRDPEDANATTPRAQFRKLEGSSNLQWAVLPGVLLTSAIQAQWTTTPLYSPDQLTIGALSTVRGFKDAPFTVDRGAHARNELAVRLPVDWMSTVLGTSEWTWANNRVKGLEGYAFLDAGYGQQLANDKRDALVGAGVGIRYRDSRFTADLSMGQGVYRLNPLPNQPLERDIYLNVSTKLF